MVVCRSGWRTSDGHPAREQAAAAARRLLGGFVPQPQASRLRSGGGGSWGGRSSSGLRSAARSSPRRFRPPAAPFGVLSGVGCSRCRASTSDAAATPSAPFVVPPHCAAGRPRYAAAWVGVRRRASALRRFVFEGCPPTPPLLPFSGWLAIVRAFHLKSTSQKESQPPQAGAKTLRPPAWHHAPGCCAPSSLHSPGSFGVMRSFGVMQHFLTEDRSLTSGVMQHFLT